MSTESVTTSEDGGRKSSKPIMEKRRRARINASLAELKTLLMDVIKSEGTRASKMEKADILEMTVRHLRQLQRQNVTGCGTFSQAPVSKYQLGFNECANEISQFLGTVDTTNVELRARILDHLAGRVSSVEPHRFSPDITCSATSGPTSHSKYADIRPNIEAVISSTTYPRDPSPFTSASQRSPPESNAQSKFKLSTSILQEACPVIGSKNISSAPDHQKSEHNREVNIGCVNDINNNSSFKDDGMSSRYKPSQSDSTSVGKSTPIKEQTLMNEQKTSAPNIPSTYTATGSMCGGVQFIPAGFSAGNVAIVIPSNMAANGPITGYLLPVPVYTPPVLPSVPNQPVILQTNGNISTKTNSVSISNVGSSQKQSAITSVSNPSVEGTRASQNSTLMDKFNQSRDEGPQRDGDMWRPW